MEIRKNNFTKMTNVYSVFIICSQYIAVTLMWEIMDDVLFCFHIILRMMISAMIFLIVVIVSNYSMMFFICYGLNTYGPWLQKYHNVDLWCYRVIVSTSSYFCSPYFVALFSWETVLHCLNTPIV